MPIPDFTTVVGVDRKHLLQLHHTWPTWRKHKPMLLDHPMLVFYDRREVSVDRIRATVDHPKVTMISWPPGPQEFEAEEDGKWGRSQRYKMLAGFVHAPARYVQTDYWLKIDTDTIATGMNDWIDEQWFDDSPVIVASPWSFTKPADQMMKLDEWANKIYPLRKRPPLNLVPQEGWSRVRHSRIISWCGFFDTNFTDYCAQLADMFTGPCQLPVPSQDGYMWYCAERLGRNIGKARMKRRGWLHRSTMHNVEHESMRAMG